MPTTAPVFVAPGYTPAGAGLPEYMPGEPKPTVERSPHRRVLPPTREPTIFAGDEPRTVATDGAYWKTMDPVAWGVRLPFLDEDLGPYQQTVNQQTVRRCAFIIGGIGVSGVSGIDLLKAQSDERKCFVARMFEHCANADRAQIERFETYGPQLSEEFRDMLRKTRASASAFAWDACKQGDTDAVRQAVEKAKRAWGAFSGRLDAVH